MSVDGTTFGGLMALRQVVGLHTRGWIQRRPMRLREATVIDVDAC
jgi:hypothetical protein